MAFQPGVLGPGWDGFTGATLTSANQTGAHDRCDASERSPEAARV